MCGYAWVFITTGLMELANVDVQDLTKRAETKDAKAKRSREEESESFFTWFNPDDQDLELAEIIKEELWPNPAKYYLGVCLPPLFSISSPRHRLL